MSFVKKVWKDRLSAFPKRWKIKFEGSAETQTAELELDDGTVITQGDRFNAATMNDLEQRIENAFNEASIGVTSFNDRSGAVQSQSGDYTSSQITHIYSDESTTDVQTAINTIEAEIAGISTGSLETYDASPGQWDTTPTTGSTKPVISDGINTEIKKKLPTYASDSTAWDTSPTASSTKPVTSGGVKTQIDSINGNKANQAVIATRQANLTASRKYAIGDEFIYNNTLYKATAVIASGAAINIGSSGNATTADNVTTQIGNLIATTSGTCSLDLRNVDVFWYGQVNYSVTKSGYTPIAWNCTVSNFAGLTNLQVESATVSSGQLQLTMYGSPFADQAKVNHTVTVRVVWLKNK